ncbi:hypothetical protein [Gordonia neofelifaecis]|uniref:Uncharacterized protein n=1 Tax=Gordonia neofelifaecis NRRL B-59395 TaxID=644548 RepID=F1YFT7_9ACTN|nr:hypothetical protein [Gordonia neofelifaecis]EGD56514.1 hypothetical protein SCNU_03147 [Gordonia neofelifaecis NRRL B-59395]
MSRQLVTAIYLLVMIALIVGVDFAFLRDQTGLRLIVNVAIVLVFLGGYFLFLRPR